MEKSKDVWELELKLAQKNVSVYHRTLFFVGSKGGGKTTLIYKLIDKKESVKPTLALEYIFARKQRTNGIVKDLCNIWELGEGTFFINLIEHAINMNNIENLTIFMILDLSKPNEIVFLSENLLNYLNEILKNIISKCTKELQNRLQEHIVERVKGISDQQYIKPLMVPLIMIGTKYDIFQEMESEKRKLVNKYLRYIAHYNGASLFYCSNTSDSIMKRMKSLLLSYAFNTAFEQAKEFDKILSINFGQDSFNSIGNESLESLKTAMLNQWPYNEENIIIPEDPSKDSNFIERDVDFIRLMKDKELENYKLKMDFKKMQI